LIWRDRWKSPNGLSGVRAVINAFLVELAAWRAADTDPADDVAAGHDRHPADRVGEGPTRLGCIRQIFLKSCATSFSN
jgi:hypothetical protein